MKEDEHKAWVEPDNVEGIPIQDPKFMGEVDYIKDRIDHIHFFEGLSELRPDMLEGMREWLQEILDNWPNRLVEESSGDHKNS